MNIGKNFPISLASSPPPRRQFKSPTIAVEKLTAEISIYIKRPTTADPVNWPATGKMRVTMVFVTDGDRA